MQTFKLALALDVKAVVPEGFLQEARDEAQKADAPAFLKQLQATYPDDDDQFMLAILKNATRIHLRGSLINHLSRAGIGGTVSPVRYEELPLAEAVLIGRAKALELAEVPVLAQMG